jgi:phosphatidylinositol glycan class A protein
MFFSYSPGRGHSLCRLVRYRRENTVLRGQLLETSEKDPASLSVRQNVYVIPNAIVAEQFKPAPVQDISDTSMYLYLLLYSQKSFDSVQ